MVPIFSKIRYALRKLQYFGVIAYIKERIETKILILKIVIFDNKING